MAANRILWALSKKTAVPHAGSTRNSSKASDGSGSGLSGLSGNDREKDSEDLGPSQTVGRGAGNCASSLSYLCPVHDRPTVAGGLPDLEVGEPVSGDGHIDPHVTARGKGRGKASCGSSASCDAYATT